MTQQNLPELAKQGHPQAIATLLNRVLQPQGVTAKAILKEDCLHILLESDLLPDQQTFAPIVYEEITQMGVESIPTLLIYGRQKGIKEPGWSETIDLAALHSYEDDFPPIGESNYNYDDEYDAHPLNNSDDEAEDYGNLSDVQVPAATTSKRKAFNLDQTQLKKLLPLLAIPIVLLIGGGIWWFLNRTPSTQVAPATAPNAPVAGTPASPAASVASNDPWREGVNAAMSAAQQTQTASTKAEWNAVASQWQAAINLMKAVPQSNPNYRTAQQKAVDYQRNLEYAQRAAATRP